MKISGWFRLGIAGWALAVGVAPAKQGKGQVPPLPDDIELVKDVEYGKVGERSLKLDLLRLKKPPEGRRPALVWIHGGGWWQGSKDASQHVARSISYAQDGYVCFLVDYRLTPEAPFPAQIQDVKCAIRFLRANAEKLSVDPDRIGAWGASAGGHLASLLATSAGVTEFEGTGGWQDQSSRVAAACSLSGAFDLVERLDQAKDGEDSEYARKVFSLFVGGDPEKGRPLLEAASPAKYITRDDPPLLLMHGDADDKLPFSQSVEFHETLQKAGSESTLVIVKGGGHGVGAGAIREHVPAFLAKYLKGDAESRAPETR